MTCHAFGVLPICSCLRCLVSVAVSGALWQSDLLLNRIILYIIHALFCFLSSSWTSAVTHSYHTRAVSTGPLYTLDKHSKWVKNKQIYSFSVLLLGICFALMTATHSSCQEKGGQGLHKYLQIFPNACLPVQPDTKPHALQVCESYQLKQLPSHSHLSSSWNSSWPVTLILKLNIWIVYRFDRKSVPKLGHKVWEKWRISDGVFSHGNTEASYRYSNESGLLFSILFLQRSAKQLNYRQFLCRHNVKGIQETTQ